MVQYLSQDDPSKEMCKTFIILVSVYLQDSNVTCVTKLLIKILLKSIETCLIDISFVHDFTVIVYDAIEHQF